jgi:hypothetical protein
MYSVSCAKYETTEFDRKSMIQAGDWLVFFAIRSSLLQGVIWPNYLTATGAAQSEALQDATPTIYTAICRRQSIDDLAQQA